MPIDKLEVFGHHCPGLIAFQCSGWSPCTPFIRSNGVVTGCDGHNEVRIRYCPFCGKLIWKEE